MAGALEYYGVRPNMGMDAKSMRRVLEQIDQELAMITSEPFEAWRYGHISSALTSLGRYAKELRQEYNVGPYASRRL